MIGWTGLEKPSSGRDRVIDWLVKSMSDPEELVILLLGLAKLLLDRKNLECLWVPFKLSDWGGLLHSADLVSWVSLLSGGFLVNGDSDAL